MNDRLILRRELKNGIINYKLTVDEVDDGRLCVLVFSQRYDNHHALWIKEFSSELCGINSYDGPNLFGIEDFEDCAEKRLYEMIKEKALYFAQRLISKNPRLKDKPLEEIIEDRTKPKTA